MAGCQPAELDWTIAFDTMATATQTARIDAEIHRGSCPGDQLLYSSTIHPRVVVPLPELEEGRACISVRAGNGSCEWFASGSESVDLPGDGPITIVLSSDATSVPNCNTTCVSGQCSAPAINESCLQVCERAATQGCNLYREDCMQLCSSVDAVAVRASCTESFRRYLDCAALDVCSTDTRCAGPTAELASCAARYCQLMPLDTDCALVVGTF